MTNPAFPPYTVRLSLDAFFFRDPIAALDYGQQYSERYTGFVCRPVCAFILPDGDHLQRWVIEVAATDNPTVRLGYIA